MYYHLSFQPLVIWTMGSLAFCHAIRIIYLPVMASSLSANESAENIVSNIVYVLRRLVK